MKKWFLTQKSNMVDLNKYDKIWYEIKRSDWTIVFISSIDHDTCISIGEFENIDEAKKYIKSIYEFTLIGENNG